MNKLIMALLPKQYKAMFEVSQKIFQNMDNDTKRKNIYEYILKIFAEDGDGGSRVTVGEWSKLCGKLGILKKK